MSREKSMDTDDIHRSAFRTGLPAFRRFPLVGAGGGA